MWCGVVLAHIAILIPPHLAYRYWQLREAYQKEFRLRKKIFNQLQELRGNIRVFVRVRPLLKNEVVRFGIELLQYNSCKKGKAFISTPTMISPPFSNAQMHKCSNAKKSFCGWDAHFIHFTSRDCVINYILLT